MEEIRSRRLSRRGAKLARAGSWIFGFLAAVSVFSLAREALGPSWPLLRACIHTAVLAVSLAAGYATTRVLRNAR